MTPKDVFETQRRVQKSLEGPVSAYLARQASWEKAMESPVQRYFKQQANLYRTLEDPVASYVKRQATLERAMESPVERYFKQQEKVRTALEGPITSYFSRRDAVQRAMEWPVARYLATLGTVDLAAVNHGSVDALLRDMEAAQPDAVAVDDPSPLFRWISVATVLPSIGQVRLALELLGIAMAVANAAEAYAEVEAGPTTAKVEATVGVLIALAGYLLRLAERN